MSAESHDRKAQKLLDGYNLVIHIIELRNGKSFNRMFEETERSGSPYTWTEDQKMVRELKMKIQALKHIHNLR